jgi:hypothetical protein
MCAVQDSFKHWTAARRRIDIEGFTTYFPDGLFVTTMKLKDGALVHNLGSYRIAGIRRVNSRQSGNESRAMQRVALSGI